MASARVAIFKRKHLATLRVGCWSAAAQFSFSPLQATIFVEHGPPTLLLRFGKPGNSRFAHYKLQWWAGCRPELCAGSYARIGLIWLFHGVFGADVNEVREAQSYNLACIVPMAPISLFAHHGIEA